MVQPKINAHDLMLTMEVTPTKEPETFIQKYGLEKFIQREEYDETIERAVLKELDEPAFGIESKARERLKGIVGKMRYLAIDPSFLSMEHPTNGGQFYIAEWGGMAPPIYYKVTLPRFAVYSLNSPECVLTVKKYSGQPSRSISPSTALVISSNLSSAFTIERTEFVKPGKLHNLSYNQCGLTKELSYASRFEGLIPKETRNQIRIAQKLFKDDIYIIAEAETWLERSFLGYNGAQIVTVGFKVASPNDDPLIVGVANNTCYLISEFNCTPLEQYVVDKAKRNKR